MCTENWSGEDEFRSFDDCHVWVPFYLIGNLFGLFHGIFNLTLSIKRLAQVPSFSAKAVSVGSGFIILAYTTRIANSWTLGERNLLLNFLLACGFGCLWISIVRFCFQYLKALFLMDKLKGKGTEAHLPAAERAFQVFMIFCFFTEILFLNLPCLVPSMPLFPTYLILCLVQGDILSMIFFYFGLKIRFILTSVNSESYQKVIRNLDLVLIPWVVICVLGTIVLICMFSIPALQRQQYIVTPFLFSSFQLLNTLLVFVSKSKKYRDDGQSTHTLETHKVATRHAPHDQSSTELHSPASNEFKLEEKELKELKEDDNPLVLSSSQSQIPQTPRSHHSPDIDNSEHRRLVIREEEHSQVATPESSQHTLHQRSSSPPPPSPLPSSSSPTSQESEGAVKIAPSSVDFSVLKTQPSPSTDLPVSEGTESTQEGNEPPSDRKENG